MQVDRRGCLVRRGPGRISLSLDGAAIRLTPSEARAAGAPFQMLSPKEVRSLEALADVLAPGARDAGFSHYIDHQLALSPKDTRLAVRFVDWPPPYAGFYRGGLAALDAASMAVHCICFADLPRQKASRMVGGMAEGTPTGWHSVPAQLFRFVLRSDAMEVVYGTADEAIRPGDRYLAQMRPPSRW